MTAWPLAPVSALTPRRLDGVVVQNAKSNLWPVAVMIDNHSAARPQAGLGKASVVYEALAEGGIPRFMAVFAAGSIPLIGPVRSARPYFVRYAAEYRAGLAHAGGSPDSLILLNSLRMPNIEGLKGRTASYFFRRGSGVHSLFTSSARMEAALRAAKVWNKKPTYQSWTFKTEAPLKKRRKGVHGAEINLGGGAAYVSRYEYDRKRNIYRRFTGGRPQLDRSTGKQVYAKNVVLIRVPRERVLDRKGRLDIKVIGSGKAVLMQDGYSTTIKWRKRSTYGRTEFTTMSGQPVKFNPGPIWITVVPAGRAYRLF